jgi:hypothetical protein
MTPAIDDGLTMTAWHCEVDGEAKGPFSEDDLKRLIRDGKLTSASRVWNKNRGGDWLKASETELAELLPPPLPRRDAETGSPPFHYSMNAPSQFTPNLEAGSVMTKAYFDKVMKIIPFEYARIVYIVGMIACCLVFKEIFKWLYLYFAYSYKWDFLALAYCGIVIACVICLVQMGLALGGKINWNFSLLAVILSILPFCTYLILGFWSVTFRFFPFYFRWHAVPFLIIMCCSSLYAGSVAYFQLNKNQNEKQGLPN